MQRVGCMCRHVDVSTDLVLMEFSPTRNTTLLRTIDMISLFRKSNDTRITPCPTLDISKLSFKDDKD